MFYFFFYKGDENIIMAAGGAGLAAPIFYIECFLVLIIPYYFFRKIKLLNSFIIVQMDIEKCLYNEILKMRLDPELEK